MISWLAVSRNRTGHAPAILAQLARRTGLATGAALADERIHRRGLVSQVVAFGLCWVGDHASTIEPARADTTAARGTARNTPGHW